MYVYMCIVCIYCIWQTISKSVGLIIMDRATNLARHHFDSPHSAQFFLALILHLMSYPSSSTLQSHGTIVLQAERRSKLE